MRGWPLSEQRMNSSAADARDGTRVPIMKCRTSSAAAQLKGSVTTQVAVFRRPLRSVCALLTITASALLNTHEGARAQPLAASTSAPIYFGDAPLASVLDDGTGATQYTALQGVVTGTVVVSPDRTQVAWDATVGGLSTLEVANIDGTNLVTVWAGISAGRPVWKADGSALAFLGQLTNDQAGVVIEPLHGGKQQVVPTVALAGQFEPTDWSADGGTLIGVYTANLGCNGAAFQDQVSAIATLALASRVVLPLTHDCLDGAALVRDLAPALSPDGAQLAFIRFGASPSLDVMNRDGSGRHTVFTGNPCCGMPAWSPDGTRLAYYTDGADGAAVYVMNADGTQAQRVASAAFHPALIQWGYPGDLAALTEAASSSPPANAPTVPATIIALSVNPTKSVAASPVTLTATASAAAAGEVPAGTAEFRDATTGNVIVSAPLVAGSATVTVDDFPVGDHQLSVVYKPADPRAFAPSSSPAVGVTVVAAAQGQARVAPSDAQVGGLTITTPYSPGHPINLGPLVLNNSGTSLVASAVFGCVNTPTDAIYVTDNRNGNTNWSAYISSTDFTDRASNRINGENLGLTGIALQPLDAATTLHMPALTTVDLTPSAAVDPRDPGSNGLKNGPHMFATTTHGGQGSIGVCGTLTLTAPTSTPPGIYSSTLTLTVG